MNQKILSTSFLSFIITLIIFCIVLCILYGSLDILNIIQSLMLLIICTAGLTLIPIIALFFAVMSFVNKILIKIFKINIKNLSISQKKIISYINSCEAANMSKKEIYKKLLEVGGWKIKDIDDAYKIRKEIKCYNNKNII
jgi:hypothetical protein